MDTNILEGWIVQLIEPALVILFAILLFGLKRFASWLIKKAELSTTEQEALQALLEGMAIAQNDIVRQAKAAAEDGKLSKEEIEKAENFAIDYAKSVATGPAKDLLLSWSKTRFSSLIKQLLAKYTKA